MGFIRGARQDPRYAQKQAKELDSLPTSIILTQPVDLQKVNVGSLQGWLCWRIQEVLGGVEDEILAGMIGNVLEEEREKMSRIKGPAGSTRSWSPKELQHTLGPFLSEEVARTFMEELWVLLLDAQTAPDGIPQAWGPAERSKFVGDQNEVVEEQPKKEKVMLGSSSATAQMRLRSPERVIGRLIEDVKEDSRTRERGRYFEDSRTHGDNRRNDYSSRRVDYRETRRDDYRETRRDRGDSGREDIRRHDDHRTDRVDRREEYRSRDYRGRSRTRSRSRTRGHGKIPSPQRTPSPSHRRQRDFSADTYSSASSRSPSPLREIIIEPIQEKEVVRLSSSSRSRSRSSSPFLSRSHSRSRSRSRSKKSHKHKKHRHHKKKHHKHKRHHRRSHSTSRSRSRSPSKSNSPTKSPRSPNREDREMSHLETLLRRKALESVQQRSRD